MWVRHALAVTLLAAVTLAAPGAASAAPGAAGLASAAPRPDCPAEVATPAAAVAAARSCGRRVEVSSGRTEAGQVFANPNGTSTMELAAVPQRVRRPDGSWAAVDPTLRRGPGGSLVPVASTLDVRFSDGGDTALVTVVRGGRVVTLGWPAPLPRPTVDRDTATYPEVLPGVDLVLRATADGFTQVLVVKSAAAAANPALREIGYPVAGRGVTLAENGQGGFTATDPDGTVVVQSGGAAMWDATRRADAGTDAVPSSAREIGDGARAATAGTRFAGGRLLVTPDRGLLTGAGTTYPVYIDPPSFGVAASRWAYANDRNANNELSFARVGKSPEQGYIYRSFFEFPMSSGNQTLIGAKIHSATFSITLHHSSSCGTTPVYAWRTSVIGSTPRTAWSPGLNQVLEGVWAAANKESCYTSATPTLFFGGNLTGDLQNLINWGNTTYTVGLSTMDANGGGEGDSARWKKFYQDTARLVVTYNHVPNTPSEADMSIDPSLACGPAPVILNSTQGVTLRTRLSDADGENVRAQWTVNGIPAQYAPPVSESIASGLQVTTRIPAEAFTNGTTYSWRVRAIDQADASADGPACAFTVDNSVPGVPTATSTDLALTTGLIPPAPPPTAVTGRPAAVTLAPGPGTSVITGYVIGIGAGAPAEPSIWVPAGADGRAVSAVVPIAAGTTTNYLKVQARNATGQPGATITYKFKANAGAVSHVRRDATGDGRADVTTLAEAGPGTSALWRWDGLTDGTGVRAPVAPQDAAGSYPTASTTLTHGDFDGDGRSDVGVVQAKGTGSQLTVQRSDGNSLLGTTELWSDATWAPSRLKSLAGDFTGDGRDDLVVVKDEGASTWKAWVFAATGSPGSVQVAAPAVWWANPPGWADWNRMKILAGDFNGDGKVDFGHIYDYGSCQTKLWIHYSTGSAFQGGVDQWDSGAGSRFCWDRTTVVAGDFTGDGRDDVGSFIDVGSCQTQLWVQPAKSTGDGFATPVMQFDSGQSSWCWSAAEPSVGDLNGDGRADVAVVYRCCGPRQYSLWRLLATGGTMASPGLLWRGTLGPDGTSTVAVNPATTYTIVARHSGLCLDVSSNSVANGAGVWQWGCHGYSNQAFRLVPTGAAHYGLRPAHTSGMCVSAGSSPANGTAAFQFQCGPFGDQVYKLEYVGGSGSDTVVRLRPVHSDKCLDIASARLDQGAVAWQWDCHGGTNQQFYLRPTGITPYNLMGSYPMSESGGSTLADTSGRNATATLTSGATVGSGYGTFNGGSGYAQTAGPAVDTSQSFTVSAWVRLNSTSNYVTAASQDGTTMGGFNLGYQPPQDGNVWAFEMRNSDAYVSGAKSRASAPATFNTWTHLVGVRDVGSNQIHLYVNGQLAGTAGYTYRWNAAGPLTVGRTTWYGSPADLWPGDIDDVRIYNRALGADEIATLHATRA